MILLRASASLHHVEGGWLSTNWHSVRPDPENPSFGDPRVLNDDRLVPGAAWPMHRTATSRASGTWPREPSSTHSRGADAVLPPCSVERVSLGSGMEHWERNHSQTEPMRFIRCGSCRPGGVWSLRSQRELTEGGTEGAVRAALGPGPGYGAPDAPMSSGAATVHQDAAVYATLLEPGTEVTHRFPTGFGGYAFVVRGSARLPGTGESGDLDEGGAVKVVGEGEIMIQAGEHGAEALVVQTRVGHPEP